MESEIRKLYEELLDGWNRRSASEMANLFTEYGSMIGFDGSQINGGHEIEATLAPIFADHPTARYVSIVQEIRELAPNVMLLRAVAGMVPPGKTEINPATNVIHSVIAVKEGEIWQIALYQNTPAQFHGRPKLVEEMTAALQKLVV